MLSPDFDRASWMDLGPAVPRSWGISWMGPLYLWLRACPSRGSGSKGDGARCRTGDNLAIWLQSPSKKSSYRGTRGCQPALVTSHRLCLLCLDPVRLYVITEDIGCAAVTLGSLFTILWAKSLIFLIPKT